MEIESITINRPKQRPENTRVILRWENDKETVISCNHVIGTRRVLAERKIKSVAVSSEATKDIARRITTVKNSDRSTEAKERIIETLKSPQEMEFACVRAKERLLEQKSRELQQTMVLDIADSVLKSLGDILKRYEEN